MCKVKKLGKNESIKKQTGTNALPVVGRLEAFRLPVQRLFLNIFLIMVD